MYDLYVLQFEVSDDLPKETRTATTSLDENEPRSRERDLEGDSRKARTRSHIEHDAVEQRAQQGPECETRENMTAGQQSAITIGHQVHAARPLKQEAGVAPKRVAPRSPRCGRGVRTQGGNAVIERVEILSQFF